MIALDCETTGLDLRHGAKPFLVTLCNEAGENSFWEWDADPVTREPFVLAEDLLEIESTLEGEDVVIQNPKFDVLAWSTLYRSVFLKEPKLWKKTWDTLLAGHILRSNEPHNLEAMVLTYLSENIQAYESDLKQIVEKARRLARRDYPDWMIAKKGLANMPSIKGKLWKNDLWLPRAIATEENYPEEHPWWSVCSRYANVDSAVLIPLFKIQEKLLRADDLWEIYLERLKILPIIYKMENRGITANKNRLEELSEEYVSVSETCRNVCINLADGEIEKLPINGRSNDLDKIVFGRFGLVSTKKTDKGNPSMDKTVLEDWLLSLDSKSKAYTFIKNLKDYRKRQTAIGYMNSYKSFWIPANNDGWYVLHPSLNPTGTHTLRWSSSNPNEQNISKKEGFNLRYIFGPAPGREWWSLDASNIELRLPAYKAEETEMIELFEKPDEPPYFGSYHLLVFDTLHPDKWARDDPEGLLKAKDRHSSTWYSWTKNGNFAVQYGAMESSGTADRAYHLDGAQHIIQDRFKNIAKLNQSIIKQAERTGYVETMPDKTVNPRRGYPLYCTRTNYGKILPTVPLNYYIQGTAMWWMMVGMISCQEYLETLPNHYMIIQVHDELVFDFPFVKNKGNLPKIKKIRHLMERSGDRIGIPTPVNIDYHIETWSEGVSV